MNKRAYPPFHKTFLAEGFFPELKGRVKFQETEDSYYYRAGEFLYKIRKERYEPASPAVREAYTREVAKTGGLWAPGVYQGVLPIVQGNGGFRLGGEGPPVAFAQKLVFLTGGHWMAQLIQAGKLTPTGLGRLARFLAERHAAPPEKETNGELGRPEYLQGLFEDLFYQAKKYVGVTVPAQLAEIVERPVFKFIGESRKLFRRRQKKNLIVRCHGALVPEHIYFRGREILAVSPLYGSPKFRVLDATADLATLLNELELRGRGDLAPLLLKRYASHAKDRDAGRVVPLFRTLQALHMGQMVSEKLAAPGTPAEDRELLLPRAQRFFNLAATIAPGITP